MPGGGKRRALARGRGAGIALLAAVCLAAPLARPAYAQLVDAPSAEIPALISADEVTYDEQLGIVTAYGNVEISHDERILIADVVSYNLNTEVVTASGDITLLEPDGEVAFASYAELTGDLREGFIRDIRLLLTDDSRLAANSGQRIGGNKSRLRKAVYSPCRLCADDPDRAPLWQIKAAEVVHDQEAKVIQYEHAFLEFFGVPVAYAPYFEHPDPTVERKSGFLAPTFGSSDILGQTFQLPYYYTIDRNQDFTFAPVFTTEQSIVLAGEYRQLFETGRFDFNGSATIADRVNNDGRVKDDRFRGHIDATGDFDIDDTWRWGFKANRSTDDTYLRVYNFSNERTLTSTAFLEGLRGRNYMALRGFTYQGLRETDQNDEAPIILPIADYNFVSRPGRLGNQYFIDANVLNLVRIDGRDTRRIGLTAGWKLPYTSAIGDVYTVTAQVRADGYWTNDFDPDTNDPSPEDGTGSDFDGRIFPQLAVDWRYPFVNADPEFQQTIEPIAQVVLAPIAGNPDGIPNEDSLSVEFDDTNLFSLNRFPGRDRVDTGTRFTYGLKWSGLSERGGFTSAFVGQSYRVKSNSDFAENSGLRDQLSDIVGRIRVNPLEHVDILYRFRLDKDDLEARRNELNLSVGPPAFNLDANYFFIASDADIDQNVAREELFLRASSQLTEHWSTFAAYLRDIEEDRSLFMRFGVTYDDECFRIEAVAQRSFFSDREIEPDDSIFFNVVFKTLGEVGT